MNEIPAPRRVQPAASSPAPGRAQLNSLSHALACLLDTLAESPMTAHRDVNAFAKGAFENTMGATGVHGTDLYVPLRAMFDEAMLDTATDFLDCVLDMLDGA